MNKSLQTRLSIWLSAAIVAVALIAGTFSFVAAFDEAIEMQDYLLTEMAALVSAGRHFFDPRLRSTHSA